MNRRTTRRNFIKQIGQTFAVGLGAVTLDGVLTQPSHAAEGGVTDAVPSQGPLNYIKYTCCANASLCGGGCGSGQVRFRCSPSLGCQPYCTGCQSASPNCYTFDSRGCV